MNLAPIWKKMHHRVLVGLGLIKKVKQKRQAAKANITMYDDIEPSLIPKDAEAVAGYVGGQWPTYRQIVKGWPKAKHLSIAIAATEDADVLDIERGNATPDQAPNWLVRQKTRGKKKPILYTSASTFQALVDLMSSHGHKYGKDYLVWTAHYYSPAPHFCGPQCGFGIKQKAHATQYWDMVEGKNLDVSICEPRLFA